MVCTSLVAHYDHFFFVFQQFEIWKVAKMTSQAASSEETPWVEKYRPTTLSEVQAQDEAVGALRACLSEGCNMPHFLFYGPPGTGKTTAILALAMELFGPDFIHSRVRELNASDDRGIAVVREKIKVFAQGSVGTAGSRAVQSDGRTYPVPPFKLIILDEADALLPDAQAALRRMMEDFCDVTRFCILCNYVSRIIDPITSRCAKYRFKPLVKEALYSRLRFIAASEGIVVSDASLKALDEASGGDMRVAIMHLQSACRASGPDLRHEDFVTVSARVPDELMHSYTQALMSRKMDSIMHYTRMLASAGFSAGQVVLQLQKFLVSDVCRLDSAAKGNLLLKLCEIEMRLIAGSDDYLQLMDIGAAVMSE
eukprot:gene5995-4300_t